NTIICFFILHSGEKITVIGQRDQSVFKKFTIITHIRYYTICFAMNK
ncbi:uncharacterized protein METZ01_LOCUS114959, partial [marine metagenome]